MRAQENMRTLCVICHGVESAKLAGRNAAARRAAKIMKPGGGGAGGMPCKRTKPRAPLSEEEKARLLWEADGDDDFAPAVAKPVAKKKNKRAAPQAVVE
jgi:hypothetical protein